MVTYKATTKMELRDLGEDEDEDEDIWTEYETIFNDDMDGIAEKHAEYLYYNYDYYELRNDWGTDDYVIVVKDSNGNKKEFSICVEPVPHFRATELER